MARLPRVVVVDVPQHVTHRGNARQAILSTDADRITYLELLREYAARTTTQFHFRTMKISEIGVRPVYPQIFFAFFAYCWKKPVNGPSVPMFPGDHPTALALSI